MSPRNSKKKPAAKAKAKAKTSSGEAPQADVYVGLLFVGVASLVAGIVFLVLELQAYEWAMGPS